MSRETYEQLVTLVRAYFESAGPFSARLDDDGCILLSNETDEGDDWVIIDGSELSFVLFEASLVTAGHLQ